MFVCALRLYPAKPGWGLCCVRLGTGVGFTPLILAGVSGVCFWLRVSVAPRHFSLGCWGVCACVCPLLQGTLGVHRTSLCIPFPRHASGILFGTPGSEVLGCRTLCLVSQSSAGLRMQRYPRSGGHVWPGRLQGAGCLSNRAMGPGSPTVTWRVCLGTGFGLHPAIPGSGSLCVYSGWGFAFTLPILAGVFECVCWCARSAFNPPFMAGICGAFIRVPVLASPRHAGCGL